MSETVDSFTRPTDAAGRVLYSSTRAFALLGGLVLCAMAVLTTVSVVGRAFFNTPVTGDFELTAIGTGVAVFAFLPYCQLKRANIVVDVFTSNAPFRARAFLDALGSLAYGVIMALMTWRTSLGGVDMYDVNETTLILAVPRWWTFPLAVVCLALLCVVCVYTLVRSLDEMRFERPL
jgi:TRAP-type C4-dicarboxylate transport system permease small subunit